MLRYERVTRFNLKAPSSNFRKLAMKLMRQQASILVQLHTSHVPMQAYLHCFKLVNSPICPSCRNEPETVTHYLMYCKNHANHRRQLKHSLGRDQSLGLEILGDRKRMKDLMHFINKTGRFRESHGDLHPAGPEGEEEEGR